MKRSSSKRSRRPPPTSHFAARLRLSSGTEQRKKVKFSDDAKKDLDSNATKTSEFLYFKKVWGNSSNKEVSQTSNAAVTKEKENSKIRGKFISPPKNLINHEFSEQLNEEEEKPTSSGINNTPIQDLNRNEIIFPFCKIPPLNQRPFIVSPQASRNSDDRFENRGVFLEKRRNLIKLASNTLGVAIDEFSSRRSDMIGELLLRLGRKPQSYLGLSCNKNSSSNYRDKIRLKNSNLDSNNLQTFPSIEYRNNKNNSIELSLPSLPYYNSVPDKFSFNDQEVQIQSQSLVLYEYSNNSYLDLNEFQSPVKQFNSELDIDVNLPLALYNPRNFHDGTEKFEHFNGHINEEILYKSPERNWNNVVEWKSSPIYERKKYSFSSEICDVDFVNERSLVLAKEDFSNSSGFGSNFQELGSRFPVDEYGPSSDWYSHRKNGFDFDFFE